MADPHTKFLLTEDRIPTHWVNLMADLPGRAAAAAEPADQGARGPAGPARDLPRGADRAGGLRRAGGRDPRGGARGLQALAPDAALPRPPPGAGARHAGAHLLQVRGRLAGRLAQAEHRGPAGLRERAGRHPQARDRDRRGPVGLARWPSPAAVRAGVRGLHGRLLLRPEALPPLDDGDLGRDRAPLALAAHRVRAARTPQHATGSLGIAISEAVEVAAAARGHQLLARLGAQPRPAAPDGDRPGDDRADGDGRRGAGRRHRLRRRRLELRRPRLPVAAAQPARRRDDPLRRRRAGGLPDAHPGRLRLRLRRHGGHHAADADVHARPRLRAAAGPRGRPALPRRLAARLRARERGARRGARLPPDRDVRRGRAVRPHRGHHPGARAGPRDPRGDRRGRGRQGGRRGAGDPVRPLRPRPLRPVRLRRLPGGELEDPEFSEEDMDRALAQLPDGVPAI